MLADSIELRTNSAQLQRYKIVIELIVVYNIIIDNWSKGYKCVETFLHPLHLEDNKFG